MNKVIIFDLDDTLYKEIDFVKSGFDFIAKKISLKVHKSPVLIKNKLFKYYVSGSNAFESIIDEYNLNISLNSLIEWYRFHPPSIKLSKDSYETLNFLYKNNYKIGIITDGRTKQQMNKIKALGIDKYVKNIVISESFGSSKPSKKNFEYFSKSKYTDYKKFFYVADNLEKDFIAPNNLGWVTICLLDNKTNIHSQNFKIKSDYLPRYCVKNLVDLIHIVS